ncbi:MAG: CHAT domain-containing protein [Saprospirales bacterium]|nr:CHAT domain-containing protein [Saprospirales bacterium]
MPINKNSIQALIIEGELGKAIKQLLELGKIYSPDLLNETTLLSARFNSLERDKRAGMISNDNATMRFAQIGSSLTYLLEKVEQGWQLDNGGEEAAPANTPAPGQTASGTSKQVILFLAANPKDSSRLRLDEEVRRIEGALERSRYRDQFRLEQRWAVQIPDLRRALLDEQPGIIHFSGHGSELGRIYLEDIAGNGQEVSAEALGKLFKLFADQIKCVVLNACYSETQAGEIVKHGIPVIGMNTAVPDKAAVEFSEAFYDALGAGRNIDFAFELGCSAIELYNLKAEDIPVLKKPE